MNGEEEVLVGRGANYVGNGPELERPKGRRLQVDGQRHLEGYDAGDDVFGERFGAAELCDLGSVSILLWREAMALAQSCMLHHIW